MSQLIFVSAIAALTLLGSTACASKKFVQTNVGEVNEKVDTLSNSLEQTQQRVQSNEARIQEVSKEVQSAQGAAQEASKAAAAAANAARVVDTKVAAMDKAQSKLVYEVVMSEGEGGFGFASSELPDGAKKQIDELVAKLKNEPRNVFITIEGYTDSVGPRAVNERIGLERAKAVEQYLYEAHQIPLQKMEAISFGEENPVAPNTTRAGRAQNRRVEIKVLS
jgi:outer membrane protein OmpA-like peptidoglycan-associated protein